MKQMKLIDSDELLRKLREELLPKLVREYGEEDAKNGLHFSYNDVVANISGESGVVPLCPFCRHNDEDVTENKDEDEEDDEELLPSDRMGIWESAPEYGEASYVCSKCFTIWTSSRIENMHFCPTCVSRT